VRRISIILLLLSSALLPGCLALTAVSAVPGALVEVVAGQFVGQEVSVAYSMRRTIASIQSSLRTMKLDIDLLEVEDNGGYSIAFGNTQLDGTINLRRQTERLTTIYIKVRTHTREESVETAVIGLVKKNLKNLPNGVSFIKIGFKVVREKPIQHATRLGWYRIGARLNVLPDNNNEWLKIKLPSGHSGYIRGSVVNG